MFKFILRLLLCACYGVRVEGLEKLRGSHEKTLIVANHVSFLDGVLLYAFLPMPLTFAINTQIAEGWMGRLARHFVRLFALDPLNPHSLRSLIKRVDAGDCVVIFPEGRLTRTGALMKIYQGPAMLAEKTGARLVPVHIEGAQFLPFSRSKHLFGQRWFPRIALQVQASERITINPEVRGRRRRQLAGQQLSRIMRDMVYAASDKPQSLVQTLLQSQKRYGAKHVVGEDVQRKEISYRGLISKARVLGEQLSRVTAADENVGVLLPTTLANVVTFWGLQFYGRTPAMLNFSAGAQALQAACTTASLKTVISSRQFVEKARLQSQIGAIETQVQVLYLEDIAAQVSWWDKLSGWLLSFSDRHLLGLAAQQPEHKAVILFTSGSEGLPKGVVLSHHNLLANTRQLASRVDLNPTDVALNALPLFHSFGLTAGMIMPLSLGVKAFYYPSPLHYRVIPELAYEINASILFGTNTFLANYAKKADDYDFQSLRYVFAGAEKLQNEVRDTWHHKFGLRILEGYGTTETSPVLAANTPLAHKPGSVGQLMPGIDYRLLPVPGLSHGQRLLVKGPNIMLGYLLHAEPGRLQAPKGELGAGWYDTGDIVEIDEDGFVHICGRAKRFAKVAGEMISLSTVEQLASQAEPNAEHVAVNLPDARKGEQIVLLSSQAAVARPALLEVAKQLGLPELAVPRKTFAIQQVPLLGSGKIDFQAARALALALNKQKQSAVVEA